MLVALGGYLVSRFFGPRRADADSDAQGQHAITRSLFAAVNSGQTHDIELIRALEAASLWAD